MSTTGIDPKALRQIEKMIEGTLPARERIKLRDQLRSKSELRQAYDFRIEALRELQSQAIADIELDIVESWLFPSQEKKSWLPTFSFGSISSYVLATAVVCLLLWIIPTQINLSSNSEFRSKGAPPSSSLAIDVLCNVNADENPFESVNEGTCPINGVIAFAHRISHASPEELNNLAIFGIDNAGRVLYYRPTPNDLETESQASGQWVNSKVPVEIRVNHHPGVVQIYALASRQAISIEQIDRWGKALFDGNTAFQPSSNSPTTWLEILRIRDPQSIYEICIHESSCASAQTHFVVTDRIFP